MKLFPALCFFQKFRVRKNFWGLTNTDIRVAASLLSPLLSVNLTVHKQDLMQPECKGGKKTGSNDFQMKNTVVTESEATKLKQGLVFFVCFS